MLYLFWSVTLEDVLRANNKNLIQKATALVGERPEQASAAVDIVIKRIPAMGKDELKASGDWIAETDSSRIPEIVPSFIRAFTSEIAEEDFGYASAFARWIFTHSPDRFKDISHKLIQKMDSVFMMLYRSYPSERNNAVRICDWMSMVAQQDAEKLPRMAQKIISYIANEPKFEELELYVECIAKFSPQSIREASNALLLRLDDVYVDASLKSRFATLIVQHDPELTDAVVEKMFQLSENVGYHNYGDWLALHAPERFRQRLMQALQNARTIEGRKNILDKLYQYRNILTRAQQIEIFSNIPQDMLNSIQRSHPELYNFIVQESRAMAEFNLAQGSKTSTARTLPKEMHRSIGELLRADPDLTQQFYQQRKEMRNLQREEAEEVQEREHQASGSRYPL